MKDRFGNAIQPGQRLFWVSTGLEARAVSVNGQNILIQVELTLPASAENPDNRVADFICPQETLDGGTVQ